MTAAAPSRHWAPHRGAPLTDREIEVLALVAQGVSTDQIATKTGRSSATIKTHLKRTYAKLGAFDRAHAVALAYQRRILAVPDEPGYSIQERATWVASMADSGHARALRLRAGMTLAQVGERCGVSGATVHNWELGHARPAGARMDGYYRLLRALQADFARGGGAL